MINYSSKKDNALNRIKTTKNTNTKKINIMEQTNQKFKACEFISIPLLEGGHITLEKRDFDENKPYKFIDITESLKKNKDSLIQALILRIKACQESLLRALDKDQILSVDGLAIMFNKTDKTWGFTIKSHILMLNLLEKIKQDITYLGICTGYEAYQMMKAICYYDKKFPEEILTLFLMKNHEGK